LSHKNTKEKTQDETELQKPAGVQIVWLHRKNETREHESVGDSARIIQALQKSDLRSEALSGSATFTWVSGEGEVVKEVSEWLLANCEQNGIRKEWMKSTAYWRRAR
jgi:NADPH-dependent ferric siderophore reductase